MDPIASSAASEPTVAREASSEEGRALIFTRYVRALDPSGEPPDEESFEEVWAALGRVLISELKKRGLWDSPPSYLGVYGYESWRSAGQEQHGLISEALEELLAGCYSHIFIRRLGGLEAQLKVKPNIEGLIFLGVRNFLHDAQKRHDPLGFRIFDVLRRALIAALADGELVLLRGGRKLRNETVLAFDDGADPDRLAGDELGTAVERWNDILLPDLVTARGKALERVVLVLRSLVSRLAGHGVSAFAFKQLIDPLKNDARARWGALLAAEEGPTAIESDGDLLTLVRLIQPDTGVEDRDGFDKLSACMAESLERRQEVARTRAYQSALWQYLQAFALGAAGDGMPSGRKLARHLGIPRDRLPGLFEALGEMVQTCRAAISRSPAIFGKPSVNSFEEPPDETTGPRPANRPRAVNATRRTS